MNRPIVNTLVIAAALGAAALAVKETVRSSAPAAKEERERCYGVVKAGKNDCGTPKHSCAGQSATDRDLESWVMLPKGACDKIAGGIKQPPEGQT